MAAFRGLPAGVELYAALGVDAEAGFEAVRAGYRRAALRAHPDKGGTAEAFQLVALAFETLSNEALRASYDRWLRRHSAGATRPRAATEAEGAPPWPSAAAEAENAPPRPSAPGAGGGGVRAAQRRGGEPPRRLPQQAEAALARLRQALQTLAPQVRQALLSSLGGPVRRRLLQHMEQERRGEACTSLLPVDPPSSSDEEDSDASEPWVGGCLGRQPPALEPAEAPAAAEAASVAAADGELPGGASHRRAARGVVQVDWGGVRQSYYATLSFAHLKFFTRSQPSFDMALEYHILLAQIRRQVMVAKRCDASAGDRIREACLQVLRESCTSVEEMGLRVMVKLELNKKRAGVVLASPVFSLDEALAWRERLLTDKSQGWSKFRAAWVELLQHKGYKRKRPLLSAEADAYVSDRERLLVPLFERLERQQHLAEERRAGRSEAKQLARARRAVRGVEAALEAEVAAAKRSERERRRRGLRLREGRWRWLHRVPAKDMTMADILQSFPSHLRASG